MACKHKSRVWDNGWCGVACMYCTLTQERNCEHNKETNADRIRSMSDAELAQELALIAEWDRKELAKAKRGPGLVPFMIDWLRKPAKED